MRPRTRSLNWLPADERAGVEQRRSLKVEFFAGELTNMPARRAVFCRSLFRSLLATAFMSTAPALFAAQDQKPSLRVAIVGLEHGHVEGFLSSLPSHHDVELVGVADADSSLIEKYQQRFHLDATLFYKSEANMIERVRPDAVLVYTPISEHRHAIGIAAQYGVSSMVEKPLTISYEDALAIREIARYHKVHVLVNYETTWYGSNFGAYEELRQGHIGELRRVVINDGHQGPKEIGVPPEFLSWLTDPEQNGAGALYDFGCYGVDLMTWLMHGEAPLTVTAVANHDKPYEYARVDDDATIVLQYPRAQAVVQASWNWPYGRKDMEVYGSTGSVITVGPDKLRMRHQGDSEEHSIPAPQLGPGVRDSLSYLAGVLHGSIRDEGDQSALDTNVTVMQILDAARESARTGKSVKLSGN
jgi:glucose-fructose oxidoreductase